MDEERIKAECDYCHKVSMCSTTPGTGGGGVECDPPCPEVLAHTRKLLHEARGEKAELTPELKADWAVLKSRLDAYMATCHKQGSKLSRIEKILVSVSKEGKAGLRLNELTIGHVHFESNSTLEQVAEVLKEKGSNR